MVSTLKQVNLIRLGVFSLWLRWRGAHAALQRLGARMVLPRELLRASAVVGLVLTAACSSEGGQEAKGPEILSFSSSSPEIEAGEATTLSWKISGTSGIEIVDEAGEPVELGGANPAEGEVEVRPTVDTRYHLVARGEGGKTATASTTVTVRDAREPTIVAFKAAPADIAVGGAATLSWQTTDAEEVAILYGAGEKIPLLDPKAGEGEVAVKPDATTTYRLEARRGEKTVALEATVTVHPLPQITLAASEEVIDFGEFVTLEWSSVGVDKVRISAGETVELEEERPSGGIEVSPTRKAVYEIVGTGFGGEESASVTVEVRPVVTTFLTEAVTPMPIAAPIPLSWVTAGASSLRITTSDGFSYEVPADERDEGATEAPMPADGSFFLTAILDEQEVMREVKLARLDPPAVLTFGATSEVVTAVPGSPASITLSWTTATAASLSLVANPGGPVDLSAKDVAADTIEVFVQETTNFLLTATNAAGSHDAEVEVRAVVAPTITSFSTTSPRVGLGESFSLLWTTEGAQAVHLDRDGSALPLDPSLINGQYLSQISADAQFTLKALNAAGSWVSETVLVEAGPPLITSFTADQVLTGPGATILLSWESVGGASAWVTGPGGPVAGCALNDRTTVADGGCSFVMPTQAGEFQLELVVANGIGQQTRQALELEVSAGPLILSFVSDLAQVSVADTITLSWEVSNDSLGNRPTLKLVDDLGTDWPLDAADSNLDSIEIEAAAVGQRTYSLTASTAGTNPSTRTVAVTILALPEVSLLASGPYDPNLGQPLELSWSAANATQLSVHRLTTEGDPIDPPIFTTSLSAQTGGSGTIPVFPQGLTSWRAIARNGAGNEVEADASVQFVDLELSSFDVTPAESMAGDPVTLFWKTAGASHVELQGFPQFERTYAPFIDITSSPTAVELLHDDCGEFEGAGCLEVGFPEGFTFPFDGQRRSAARFYLTGIISFDIGRKGDSLWELMYEIPSSEFPWAHLLPFWGYVDVLSYGSIFYDLGLDAKGRYLVVQWVDIDNGSRATTRLNWEVIMWEDGDFDFRYGDMTAPLRPETARGEGAVIGWQNLGGTKGVEVSAYREIPGLAHSGFAFRQAPTQSTHSVIVRPQTTQTYELIAHGYEGGTKSATKTVTVYDHPTLVASTNRKEVDRQTPFEIRWTTTNAVAVNILGPYGDVIHSAGPEELDSGVFTTSSWFAGSEEYVVEVKGHLTSSVRKTLTIEILEPFYIDSFVAEKSSIGIGEETSISWVTRGAETFELREAGEEVDSTGFNFNEGTYPVSRSQTTSYTLTITRSDGRVATKTIQVRVIQVALNSVSLSSTTLVEGEPVEISWSTMAPGGATVEVMILPVAIQEIDATVYPFEDVSETGVEHAYFRNQSTGGELISFPTGFTFPFMGEHLSEVKLLSDGYISFDPFHLNRPGFATNRLPTTQRLGINLAPFWDHLHSFTTGRIYTDYLSDAKGDRFIIQWKNYQYVHSGGINPLAPGADLNFQVAMFRDGTVEYRYSQMMGLPDQGRGDGNGASIGYQDETGYMGDSITFKEAVAGGLSNRTWRIPGILAPSGTASVVPGRNGDIKICAFSLGDMDCRTLHVSVLRRGDVAITELMFSPDGGAAANQWFELRNLSTEPVSLNGLKLVSGGSEHQIESEDPVVIQPGKFLTLAGSATPGFTPDYVYGTDLVFDPTVDGSLALAAGETDIAKVSWDSSWTFEPGRSLTLDGSEQLLGATVEPLTDAAVWCVESDLYDGQNAGSPGAVGRHCLTEYDVDYYAEMPFIDISATGTEIEGALDEVYSLTLYEWDEWDEEDPGEAIPFDFPFFGYEEPRKSLYVGLNGTITFGAMCHIGGCLPDAYNAGGVYLYGGFGPLPDSHFYHELQTIGGRQVIILQWDNFARPGRTDGLVSAQFQLWEGGDIVMVYRHIEGDDSFFGAGATLGLIGPDYTQLLFSSWRPSLRVGQSIYYRYR